MNRLLPFAMGLILTVSLVGCHHSGVCCDTDVGCCGDDFRGSACGQYDSCCDPCGGCGSCGHECCLSKLWHRFWDYGCCSSSCDVCSNGYNGYNGYNSGYNSGWSSCNGCQSCPLPAYPPNGPQAQPGNNGPPPVNGPPPANGPSPSAANNQTQAVPPALFRQSRTAAGNAARSQNTRWRQSRR